MKKIIVIVVVAALAACKPELKGELGEISDKTEGLNGNWQLSSFSQRDENNPIKEIRDLSEYYIVAGEESTKINFNSSDFSYTVDPGPGRNYFGTSGTWHLDNNQAPSFIFLEHSEDTLQLTLGSIPSNFDNQLNIELPRYCTDANNISTPTVTYIFNIQRAN